MASPSCYTHSASRYSAGPRHTERKVDMAAIPVTDEELQLDVEAYYAHGGNKSEAARARGLKRQTYASRLSVAEQRLGARLGKVVDGRVEMAESVKLRLPRKGYVKHYICTSIQNNTHLHPGFNNLVAYLEWLDSQERSSCEMLIGTYSYQLGTYGPKAVKRGKHKVASQREELWYAPEAEQYIRDESVELAPGLVWGGENNILPTTRHPLTSFESYNGRKSNVVPHAKIAMESVVSMADEATKFNYTTGTVTQRNYIQKRAGILAEQEHDYGAALICVDHEGNWWVRQLHIDEDDAIMDLGPDGYGGVRVQAGKVHHEDVVSSIYWGDAHPSELEMWVRELAWGPDGMLDQLRPDFQFFGDLFSMRSRTHHEIRDFHRTYAKHAEDEETVEEEVRITADFVNEAVRDWLETVVVSSNHDRHLDRWLNEADFRLDPVNAKFFCELQWQVLDALDRGDKDFNVLEYALKRAGSPEHVRFLALDESFVLEGVENGLHGDMGPNGSRGSTRGLTKMGRKINKGHDHTAAIRLQVYSSGACSLSFPFMRGPNSHSVSHIVTYKNGARAIVTMWSYKWRA